MFAMIGAGMAATISERILLLAKKQAEESEEQRKLDVREQRFLSLMAMLRDTISALQSKDGRKGDNVFSDALFSGEESINDEFYSGRYNDLRSQLRPWMHQVIYVADFIMDTKEPEQREFFSAAFGHIFRKTSSTI